MIEPQTRTKYKCDSFGNLTASTGTLVNSFRYSACQSDSETTLYYYRARYYDQNVGRFLSEDPLRFSAGIDFYRYVGNDSVNLRDPTGQYQLNGFTPGDAAQMILAINQLRDKLKSKPCCIDPKLRDRILNLLGSPNDGSGVTFTYHQQLSSPSGQPACAGVYGNWAFLTNRVEISNSAFGSPGCGCLASTILHEVNHLTWGNKGLQLLSQEASEADSRGVEHKCFPGRCEGW